MLAYDGVLLFPPWQSQIMCFFGNAALSDKWDSR